MYHKFLNILTIIFTLLLAVIDYIRLDKSVMVDIKVIIVFILIIYIICYKRKQAKILSLFDNMGYNNKLHSIRELIAIEHIHQEGLHNKLKFESIFFDYQITASPNTDVNSKIQYYDINYHLSFHLKRSLNNFFINKYCNLSGKNCPFNIHVICENNSLINPILITHYKKDKKEIEEIIPLIPSPVTTLGAGNDQSENFSGLYVIPISLSTNYNLNSSFHFDVKYTSKRNLNTNFNQYDFAIIPYNYTRKRIDKFQIKISSQDVIINNLELQSFDHNGKVSNPSLFKQQDKTSKEQEFELYDEFIRPKISSVHYVKFNYSAPDKDSIE